MERSQLDTLAARVDRLERQCRRWRTGGVLAVMAGACVALAVAAPRAERPPARLAGAEVRAVVVEAREVVLRDNRGRVQIRLETGARGPKLSLFGPRQKGGAALLVTPEGTPALDLQGEGRALLGVTAGGVPEFELSDAAGRVFLRALPPKDRPKAAAAPPKE